MNYYPNYYSNNYPYNGNNSSQYMMPQNQGYMAMSQSSPQFLNGKVVDSADVVKATEVPIGGYGIFPKADLSEIYIKSWNNNGTTSIITYIPTQPPEAPVESQQQQLDSSAIMEILNKINGLEAKIDILSNQGSALKSQAPAVASTPRKESNRTNEF